MTAAGASRTRVLVAVLVGVGATSFPFSVFAASLPSIAREFDASESSIAWVITLPTLGFAIAMPVLGKLGDLHGHRRTYLLGFAVSSLFAAITALAWNAPSLVVLRTLGQMCGAATGPASMALIMTVFPREERVKAMGWWSLVTAGAPTIGLVVGGPLIELIGWRPLFIIQAVAGAVAVVAARNILPETSRTSSRGFDLPGAATLGVGIAGLLFALSEGRRLGWSSPVVLVGLVLGPILLGAFVSVERRSSNPLLPLAMFSRRNFTVPVVAQFFVQTAYMGGFVIAPFLLDSIFGYQAAAITAILVARPLAFSLCGPLSGRAAVAFGERATALSGTVSMALSMAVLAYGAGARNIAAVVVGLVLSGAGNGFSQPPFQASVANAVEESDLGVASAAKTVVTQIGAAVGITLMTTLRGIGGSTTAGFAWAYWAGAAIAGVAVVVTLGLEDTERLTGSLPVEPEGHALGARITQ